MNDDAAALCTHCGLCCDGTLFDRAKAYPEDMPKLARHGVPLRENAVVPAFVLGCTRLEGTVCGIYDDRFVTCRKFRCRLLRRLDAAEIDLTEGLDRIATAQGILARLGIPLRTARARHERLQITSVWQSETDSAARGALAQEHVALLALERFLAQHFRFPPTEDGFSSPGGAV